MAWIVFSGGHTLRIDAPASTVEDTLTGNAGEVNNEWTQVLSGDAIVRINPANAAYIVEDDDYADTFGTTS